MSEHKTTKRRNWLLLLLLPPQRSGIDPPRDLVEEGRRWQETRRGLFPIVLALIPVVGVLTVVLNLLVQTRGDRDLALAIIQNLPLASLAFLVAANVLVFLVPVIAGGLLQISADRRQPAQRRMVSKGLAVIVLLVGVLVMPWYMTVLVGALIFVVWRFGHRLADGQNPSDFGTWLQPPVPEDFKLRALWLEGRNVLRKDGRNVGGVGGLVEVSSEPSRTLEQIRKRVNRRVQDIQRANRKSTVEVFFLSALYLSIGFVSILTTQLQFAPLEMVELPDRGTTVGYVYSQAPDSGVMFVRDTRELIYLDQEGILERHLCASTAFSKPIYMLLAKDESGTVDCSKA